MNRQQLLRSNLDKIDPDYEGFSYKIGKYTCPAGACLTPKELKEAQKPANQYVFIHKLDLQISRSDLLILCHLQYVFDNASVDHEYKDNYKKVLNYYLETWEFNPDLLIEPISSHQLYNFLRREHACTQS